jgi:hypothetical protein
LVWRCFGDVQNYVEPFFGSGAVLLGRPHAAGTETVNDLNGWLTNFWRALRHDPEGVAAWADYPVSELDLHARGDWLFYGGDAAAFIERVRGDADFYDVQRAGWWVWGQCSWIGSGWGPREAATAEGNAGMGVNRKLPHLGDAGMGVNRKLPHLGDAGRGNAIAEYFAKLARRLRTTRIVCGDWTRVIGPSVTTKHGITGVFLDPPYALSERQGGLYTHDTDVSASVREWAVAHGEDQLMRIVLCGYDGEHEMPGSWECVAWKAAGGYGGHGDARGRANAARERLWFSPHCLSSGQRGLFDALDENTPRRNASDPQPQRGAATMNLLGEKPGEE